MRLELFIHLHYVVCSAKFQFHKGAIRTELAAKTVNISYSFQFHKGAIRTTDSNPYFFTFIDFNSIKVRLELPPARDYQGRSKFQFHKGAIRTIVL